MSAGEFNGSPPAFRRVLLKLSGESLMGSLDYGTDPERLKLVAQQVKQVHDRGVEIAIVLGAGNIFRGVSAAAEGMDRATADYMGMLAIVLNALQLQDAMEKLGLDVRVQSAITVAEVAEPYIRRRDVMHDLRELKDEGEIGADDEHRAEVELQKLTDESIAQLEALLKGKE